MFVSNSRGVSDVAPGLGSIFSASNAALKRRSSTSLPTIDPGNTSAAIHAADNAVEERPFPVYRFHRLSEFSGFDG